MRHLASIQTIRSLSPIAGADAIECATILGWHVVVRKGEFLPGDYCVYIEIDSVLPEGIAAFESIRAKSPRIRTVRLRGQVSQGIAFPTSILPPGVAIEEGADVTDVLRITKWEAPVPPGLAGVAKGLFPSFIPKTDEERVQTMPDVLARHAGASCYITEKLDGTSATYYLRDGVFGVCSRNLELVEAPGSVYWDIAKSHRLEEALRALDMNIAIQGEIIGKGVNGNRLCLQGVHFRVFNVFYIDRFAYASCTEWLETTARLGVQPVPLITDSYLLSNSVDAILKMASIPSLINTEASAEGIVVRSHAALENGERLSFKAISNDYLLKWGE